MNMWSSALPTLSSPTLIPLAAALRITLLAVLLICCAQPAFAANQTVGATDSRLSFRGSWTSQGNGAWQFTGDPTASVSFSFTGSSIYYRGMEDWNGALNVISVDGEGSTTVDQSAGQVRNADTVRDVILFSQSGLDGTQQHTIQVNYGGSGGLGGGYLAFFGFTFDDSAGSIPSPPHDAPPPQTVTQIVTQTTSATYTPPTTSPLPQTTAATTLISSTDISSSHSSSPSTPTSSTSNVLILSTTEKTGSRSTTLITTAATVITQVLATSTTLSDGHLVTVTATQVASSEIPTFATPIASSSAVSHHDSTAIIGGVVAGALVGILIASLVIYILCRRLRSERYVQDAEDKERKPSDEYAENNGLRYAAQMMPIRSGAIDIFRSAGDIDQSIVSESVIPVPSPLRIADPTFNFDGRDTPVPSANKASAITRARVLAQAPHRLCAQESKTATIAMARTLADRASSSTVSDEAHAPGSSSPGWVHARQFSLASVPEVAPPMYTE